MLYILQDYLEYKCLLYECLDGPSRSEERFLSIQNFNKNETTSVFLISTKAGGQGITLTSDDTGIFYDNDFNPQKDFQAAARTHRKGQRKTLKIINIICKNSVEEIKTAGVQNFFRQSDPDSMHNFFSNYFVLKILKCAPQKSLFARND